MTYVIVLNYNGWKDTIGCLESLLLIDNLPFTILLVDNCSTDNSCTYLQQWAEKRFNQVTPAQPVIPLEINPAFEKKYVKPANKTPNGFQELVFLGSNHNGGYSAGNNIGIRYALQKNDADYIWLLNNDTIVDKQLLGDMLSLFDSEKQGSTPRLAMVGCKLVYYYNPTIIQCSGGVRYNPYLGVVKQLYNGYPISTSIEKIKADYIPGTSLLVNVSFIKEAGLLNEEYFLYFEELDWTARAKKLNWQIDYITHNSVLHKEGGSISGDKQKTKSALSDYCFLRSRLLYTFKYENFIAVFFIYIISFLSICVRLFRGQPERLLPMLKILFNPRSKNFLDKKPPLQITDRVKTIF